MDDYKKLDDLLIYKDGRVFNTLTNKFLKTTLENQGVFFTNPKDKKKTRVDYAVAMLYLNDGEFIESISHYYILHKDGDRKNCKLENLKLLVDPDEVKEHRFDYLKHVRDMKHVTKFCIADRYTLDIKDMTLVDICREFEISRDSAIKKAKECAYLNSRYIIAETFLDAYEAL